MSTQRQEELRDKLSRVITDMEQRGVLTCGLMQRTELLDDLMDVAVEHYEAVQAHTPRAANEEWGERRAIKDVLQRIETLEAMVPFLQTQAGRDIKMLQEDARRHGEQIQELHRRIIQVAGE